MKNVKLTIAYDGTRFKGWQIQPGKVRTVHGLITKAASRVFKTKVKIHGASRTDVGVHANAQVAHFEVKTKYSTTKIRDAMNFNLPEDVVINQVSFAPQKFHSRYSAKQKEYCYRMVLGPVRPMQDRANHLWVPYPIDVAQMKKAAKKMIGKHDFSSFSPPSRIKENPIRTISSLKIIQKNNLLTIRIKADGFLYHMVRKIVGLLLDVGRGKVKSEDIPKIIHAKNHLKSGHTAKAHGLTLVRVYY